MASTEAELLHLVDRAKDRRLTEFEILHLRGGISEMAAQLRRFSAAVGAGERKATEIIRFSLDHQMNGWGRKAALDVLDAMRSAYMLLNDGPETHSQSRGRAAAYFDAAAAFRRYIEQQESQ